MVWRIAYFRLDSRFFVPATLQSVAATYSSVIGTHPEWTPEISSQDIEAFTKNLRPPGHGIRQFLAILNGQAPLPTGVTAYLVQPDSYERLVSLNEDCHWLA